MINWHYFHKAQMLIWHLFYKAQNNILVKTIILHSKPKFYFGTYLQNASIILTLVSTYTKSHTHGKYKYSSLKKYFFHKILWEECLFFHNQLTTKAHVYYPWQNHSFL